MLPVLFISLVSTSSAYTTHRYDAFSSFGNDHPFSPFFDNVFGYENINGYRPVQVYEYAKRFNSEVISNGDRRRVDTPYSYQNQYQWNGNVPWNKVAVTLPDKVYNLYESTNQDSYNPNLNNEDVTNQRKRTNELNDTQGNASVPQISTQLDDVTRTLVINDQQITWNNDHLSSNVDNANITTRSINSANNTNSLNAPAYQNPDKINRPAKTNKRTAYKNNRPDDTTNGSHEYSTETTQDNEVTLRADEQVTKAYDYDRWIWSNGEDQMATTTVKTDLDDRAAFAGDACPDGKYKVGKICVEKD